MGATRILIVMMLLITLPAIAVALSAEETAGNDGAGIVLVRGGHGGGGHGGFGGGHGGFGHGGFRGGHGFVGHPGFHHHGGFGRGHFFGFSSSFGWYNGYCSLYSPYSGIYHGVPGRYCYSW